MGGQVAVTAVKLALCGNYGAVRQLRRIHICSVNVHYPTKFRPNRTIFAKVMDGHLKYSTPPGTCHVAEGATSWAHHDDPLTWASPRERLPLPGSPLAISGRLNMQNVRIWRFSLWGKISPPRRTPGDNVRHVVTRPLAPVGHPTNR